MKKLRKLLSMMIVVVIVGLLSVAIAIPHQVSSGEMSIDLEEGYCFKQGAWIADSYDNALILIGNAEENIVKLAIASRMDDGQYQIAAVSEQIMSYDEYCNISSHLSDKWKDGHPYFYCGVKGTTFSKVIKAIYIYVEQDDSGCWNVVGGYIDDSQEDLNYHFFSTGNPNEIGVMFLVSPQIYWPTQATMTLDHFDLTAIEKDCVEALRYLENFFTLHDSGDQDETYTIVWPDDSEIR